MENQIYSIALLFVVGSIGGFLGGLLGVGGALIFVPILTFFFKSSMGMESTEVVKSVLANSMFCVLFTGLIASYTQIKNKNFFLKPVLYTALPGLISTLSLTYLINNYNFYSKDKFAIFFVFMLLLMIARMYQKIIENQTLNAEEIAIQKYAFVGIITGLVTSLSGLGGGLIMIPLFSNLFKINLKQSISISTGVIPFFALPNVLYYGLQNFEFANSMHIGYLFPSVAIPMTIGIIIFTKMGINFGKKLSQNQIRLIFLSVIIIATIKMVYEIF